jgi:hypothetical protein
MTAVEVTGSPATADQCTRLQTGENWAPARGPAIDKGGSLKQ